MRAPRKLWQRGAATIEMTLVGIPTIFVLISIFEISRGMWMYHTLAYSVKEAMRYVIVHGKDCVTTPPAITNNCAITVGNVAQRIKDMGVGLDPAQVSIAWNPAPTTNCTLLSDCLTNTTVYPPAGSNGRGDQVTITISTPFRSALAMFWPGSRGVSFAVTNFSASASERIQF